MFLAPRQLQRAGMTGDVPYYGGRLTPWHIQGINDAARRQQQASTPPPSPPATRPRLPLDPQQALAALGYLHDCGVITAAEYTSLRGRVAP